MIPGHPACLPDARRNKSRSNLVGENKQVVFAGEVSEPFKIFELQNTASRFCGELTMIIFVCGVIFRASSSRLNRNCFDSSSLTGTGIAPHSNGGLISGVCRRCKDNFVARIDHGMNDGEDHHLAPASQ